MNGLLGRLHFLTHNFSFDTKKTVFATRTDAKMICLLLGIELRQKVLEMRPFCLSTIEIHEVLWLKMRMELRQTTGAQEADCLAC